MKKEKRKIVQLGKYSKVIVIPREFLKELRWRESQIVEVTLDKKNKRLVVKDAK